MSKKPQVGHERGRKTSRWKQLGILPSSRVSLATSQNEDEDKPDMLRPPPPPKKSLFQNEVVTAGKKSSSKTAIKPSLAAAMLSFPWPPPEHPKSVFGRVRHEDVESSKQKTSIKNKDENGNLSCCQLSSKSCCCGIMKSNVFSNGTGSRRLFFKKKCHSSVVSQSAKNKAQRNGLMISGDSQRKPGDPFLPVTVPPFNHVHTAWPGFDHAPVPNWQRKYMIAKPWPYKYQNKYERVRFKERFNAKLPDDSVIPERSSVAQLDILNRNFSGRSLASVRSPSSSSTNLMNYVNENVEDYGNCSDEDASGKENILPKQRVTLERVGSCLR